MNTVAYFITQTAIIHPTILSFALLMHKTRVMDEQMVVRNLIVLLKVNNETPVIQLLNIQTKV